jgi:ribosome maturation protein Sdo1
MVAFDLRGRGRYNKAMSSGTPLTAEQKRDEAERKRKVRELELQRERILAERTSSPHRRSALAAALEEIEVRLGELGWTVHLD